MLVLTKTNYSNIGKTLKQNMVWSTVMYPATTQTQTDIVTEPT